jgi:hypothetical protein
MRNMKSESERKRGGEDEKSKRKTGRRIGGPVVNLPLHPLLVGTQN